MDRAETADPCKDHKSTHPPPGTAQKPYRKQRAKAVPTPSSRENPSIPASSNHSRFSSYFSLGRRRTAASVTTKCAQHVEARSSGLGTPNQALQFSYMALSTGGSSCVLPSPLSPLMMMMCPVRDVSQRGISADRRCCNRRLDSGSSGYPRERGQW